MLFCSTIVRITLPTHKTLKTWVFLRSSPRVKMSLRVIDQSYTRRWIYAAISSIYPATLSIREWLCFPRNVALRFSTYKIFSKRKLECDFFWPRVIVYIFSYGSKIVLYSFTGNWRDIVYLIGSCRNFRCVLCHICRMYQSLSVYPFIRTGQRGESLV